MTENTYQSYERSVEDNMPAGSPLFTRFPQSPFSGTRVNDSLAYLASAIRNLGDQAVKLKPDGDGSYELGPNGGQVGTLAWQDADDVAIEGGFLGANVRGSVPARVVLPWFGTYSELVDQYPNLRTRGFDICDGRTSTNPVNSSQSLVMPNLLDNYLFFYNDASFIGSTGLFSHTKTTETGGSHNHGGSVGGTAITGAQAPTLSKSTGTVESGTGATPLANVSYGGPGEAHTHAITTDSGHTHSVNVRPRTAVFVPIMRVW